MASTPLPFRPCAVLYDGAAADIGWLIDQIAAHYDYLADRHIDLASPHTLHVAEARGVTEPHAFLDLLERMLAELHDSHIEANVNNSASPQLVPTGTEIWAAMRWVRERGPLISSCCATVGPAACAKA